MRHLIVFLVLFTSFAGAETFVAILETYSKVIATNEKVYITDKVRSEARKVLPENFTLMTRENISQMLPPGKNLDECEGSCLVETGRNIAADYICQARVDKVGASLFVTIELYNTADNNLVNSLSERAAGIDSLVNILESRIEKLFFPLLQNWQEEIQEGVVARKYGSDFEVGEDNRNAAEVPDEPAFGTLSFDMKFGYGVEPIFVIDGVQVKNESQRLPYGAHEVQVVHPCYELMDFDVGVKRGSKLVINQAPREALAGLVLTAEKNGKPQKLPVYVNGKKVGVTPFTGKVPVCAQVKVGKDELYGLTLKPWETTRYNHKVGTQVKTVKIGSQVWMAENLNVRLIEGSWCYDDKPENCEKQGRLYTWAAAMNLPDSCNIGACSSKIKTPHRGICPAGFHIPTDKEFSTLFETTGGKEIAGKKLRTKSGWASGKNGTDDYGFSAFPAGRRHSAGGFNLWGSAARFWSISVPDEDFGRFASFSEDGDRVEMLSTDKAHAFSVRCLRD